MMIIIGALLLYFGAEALVRGSASLAYRLGLPPLVIGLTIVGYGTSIPELIVSIQAALMDLGDVAIGNVIGSNIANSALVLGTAALFMPIPVNKRLIGKDAIVMIGMTIALSLLIFLGGYFSRMIGLIFIIGLFVYTYWALRDGQKEGYEERVPEVSKKGWVDVLFIIAGFILLPVGSRLFLDSSVALAQSIGVSDAVIGLTLVALGTSLPEMVTAVVASLRKHPDIALGNIVGSNIYNILSIVGFSALVSPYQVVNIHWIDYGLMTALAAWLWFMMRTDTLITRKEGGFVLLIYFGYFLYLYSVHA